MSNINPMPGGCRYSDILYKLVIETCGYPDSIIELGCGDGGNLAEFLTHIRKVGLDPYKKNINAALNRGLLNCKFILGSHEDLTQFECNEFAVGVTLSVLDHIEDFKNALLHMMQISNKLILLEPILKGENRQARKVETQRWENTWYHDYETFLKEQKVFYSIKHYPLYKTNSGLLYHLIYIECDTIVCYDREVI